MSLETLSTILVFIFGACIGSFLNVVIWRLPRQEKLTGRSHCANCGHQLSAVDLAPIFSLLFLRGRCRYCGKKISLRYPIIELLVGLLFVVVFRHFFTYNILGALLALKILVGVSILVCIFVIDLEHFLILDSVLWVGGIAVVLFNVLLDFFSHNFLLSPHSYLLNGIFAALIGSLPLFFIWFFSKGFWMGFGDVKLMLFLGLFLGWPLVLMNLFLGIVLGGLVGLFLLLFAGKTLKTKLPLGTFLSFSAVICLFYGSIMLKWYLGFLGF